jgi:hypothetical protein
MAAPTFTKYSHPGGYDQTQKQFSLGGTLGLSGNYTTTTGIPINFLTIVDASGNKVVLPPTFTGASGPGQGVPLPTSNIQPQGGYSMFFDPTNLSIRIFNGATELTTAALPAALTATGIPCRFYFLRG